MERREESLGTRDIAATPQGAVREEDVHEASGSRPEETARARDGDHPAHDPESASLFPDDESADFARRWEAIQTRFVDDPQHAVEEADALVASVMQRLADGYARERERLDGQWSRGEEVSTEELRVTLQRYRSFFRRLLSA